MCNTVSNKVKHRKTFSSPKTFILHCGTNDLEKTQSNDELINQTMDIVENIEKSYPQSRIILSTLLPRGDDLDKRVTTINKELENILSAKKNVKIVMHENLEKSKHLKDKKHLNEKGVKLFAQSLKRAYFNKPTRTWNFPQNQQYRTQYTQSRFYQPNPYNHYPILNNRQQKHIPQQQATENTPPPPPPPPPADGIQPL
jgi:wyosine [tRNA(Phe)-imidazoG37] synthetase (radical SAM superfamily)